MKVTCEKKELTLALGIANKAITNRNTIAVLSNVLIEAVGEAVSLTGTDLDTTFYTTAQANVIEEGAVAVPAKMLSDMVSRMPDAPITLELVDGKVKVQCGKSSYTLLSVPAEDFPTTKRMEGGENVIISQQVLKEALATTSFAASHEENRSILMGVLFEANGAELSLVATDTHRLALKKIALGIPVLEPVAVVIPAKVLIEIERLLKDDADGTVKLTFGSSEVGIEANGVTIVTRLLDGQFPNYQKIIPKESSIIVRCDRDELLKSLKRLQIVAFHSAEKIKFETKGAELLLTCESSDVGSGAETVPISKEGEDIAIAFNARYVVEVLERMNSKTAAINLTGALNPGNIKRCEGTDIADDFTYIVMPMQI